MNSRIDQLIAFTKGPIWDGDLISKQDRDELVKCRYVDHLAGWNFLTALGVQVLNNLGMLKP